MTPDCRPHPNGYLDQKDCTVHGTPWPCTVTADEHEQIHAERARP